MLKVRFRVTPVSYGTCSYNLQLEVAINPTVDFIAGTVAVRLSSLQNVYLQPNPSHRVSQVLLSGSLLTQVHSKESSDC